MAVIQDSYTSEPVVDFIGDPLNGTNRLVSTFTIVFIGGRLVQDSYNGTVPNTIQDVYNG